MRTSPRFPEKKLQKRDYCYMNKNERRRNNKCYRQMIKQMLRMYMFQDELISGVEQW